MKGYSVFGRLPYLKSLVLLVLTVPVVVMAFDLYVRHGMFFWDAKTIPCGLSAVIEHGDPNAYLNNPSYSGACAGYGYEYMLPPAITEVLVRLVGLIGIEVPIVFYGLLYFMSMVLFISAAKRFAGGWLAPLLFTCGISCGVFVFEFGGGNLTVPYLGLLLLVILLEQRIPRWEFVFSVLCVVAAAFKPLYALYLLIPLFVGAAWLSVSVAAAAISIGYAADAYFHPPAFSKWLELSVAVVYGEPHFGIMRVMQAFGLGKGDWWIQGSGFVAWCAFVIILLWRARSRLSTRRDRALAALLAVTVMQPRFKEYDAVVLIPIVFWLLAHLGSAASRSLQRQVVLLCFVVPAIWWWGRKLWLLSEVPSPSLTQFADPRWLIGTQGFFLALAALLMFVTVCFRFTDSRATGSGDD